MDKGILRTKAKLNNVLNKLTQARNVSTALRRRKQKTAILIRQHVIYLHQILITNRRRRQHGHRLRKQQMRLFFMKQMIELHANYVQMFVLLRQKHALLKSASRSTSTAKQTALTLQASAAPITPTPVIKKTQFFERVIPLLSEEMFLNNFHVTRRTFQWLCDQLSPTLSVELNRCQYIFISPEKCVALALHILANGERLSIISEQFSLHRTAIVKCLKVFCKSVKSCFGKSLQMLPQSDADCANVVAGFHKESSMPPALVGVLGVCNLPKRNKENQSDMLVRMEYLLDDRMLFRELQLSAANQTPQPPPMFSQSPNSLSQLPPRSINGHMVPAFVLAPLQQNYPLLPWLLQIYSNPLAPHELNFNKAAEYLQNLSDCAVHRLMSRWRFISQPLDISFQTASCIITTSCVLHNLLEELGEPHMLEWGNTVDVSKLKAPPKTQDDMDKADKQAIDVRDFLAHNISLQHKTP